MHRFRPARIIGLSLAGRPDTHDSTFRDARLTRGALPAFRATRSIGSIVSIIYQLATLLSPVSGLAEFLGLRYTAWGAAMAALVSTRQKATDIIDMKTEGPVQVLSVCLRYVVYWSLDDLIGYCSG